MAVVEAGLFRIIERWRPTGDACIAILDDAERALMVTRYQFANLLGVEATHYGKWRRGAVRISTAYMIRIIKLLTLHSEGVPLHMARYVHWMNGEIHWRSGNVSSGNNLLDGGWEVPEKKGEDRHKSAHVLDKRG